MRYVKPQVRLVARPQIAFSGMVESLDRHVGGSEWIDKRFYDPSGYGGGGTDAEKLIEMMGRLCYDSFGVGGNTNVTRVREDQKQ